MSRVEDNPNPRPDYLIRLTRWKLGLPIFETVFVVMMLIGVAVAVLIPVIRWIQ